MMTFELHLIATGPGPHDGPDSTARLISTHETQADAARAGAAYLVEHGAAWLQIDDGHGGITDVEECLRDGADRGAPDAARRGEAIRPAALGPRRY